MIATKELGRPRRPHQKLITLGNFVVIPDNAINNYGDLVYLSMFVDGQ